MDAERVQVAVRFGRNVRACRQRARMSQESLAFRASLHRSEISGFERHQREPRLGTVVKLAAALSVSVDDLLSGIEWKPDERGGGRFELSDPDGGPKGSQR